MEENQTTEPKTGHSNSTFYCKNILSQFDNSAKTSSITESSCKENYDSTEKQNGNEQNIDNVDKAVKRHSCAHEIKLYKQRYLMLFLFALCSMMNGFTAFQYTVVANIVSCYFDVSLSDVNWTCDVHMVVFLILVFPVMYFMDKNGIKITLVIAAILNFLGSVAQCFTIAPNRFFVVMTCQTLYAIGQVFVLSLPPFIAAVWFGTGEVGLACAMGVFGNQLGVALGFIVPPNILTNNCTEQMTISSELSMIAYPMTTISTIILVVIIFGLITGTYFTISTLLNEMVLIHFPGEEVIAGTMGALLVFAGMMGSLIIGALLDRTHKYKAISLVVFILSFVVMLAYTFLIKLEKFWIQFVMFTLLGFIMTGYLPAGYDFGAEITYPVPEAMSAGLLNASSQIFSIILTNIASPLLETYGDFASNSYFCVCLLVGTTIMACIKCKLKRADAETEADDTSPEIVQESVS
ncbi:feline leukemia virus subgroup C receptor-related protein 2-like isoform X2 [Argiope bruennichi]|uniref:feline leukemia virus subgroup C receptor-related protein 2-like isoform X2 n=1 Tax=Argiope bruennichi TaxID=94029 RepID=UPI0024947EA2|nr:feline leukemia virus subgroup C receptor-related protein 2-like isoform X2 [Argiope bruennichi]